jgi:hypothetical protein
MFGRELRGTIEQLISLAAAALLARSLVPLQQLPNRRRTACRIRLAQVAPSPLAQRRGRSATGRIGRYDGAV